MIIYFNKQKASRHKGQISIFFIGAIATLFAVTFTVINIGKGFKDKVHTANAADAGALAACSVMATGFNMVSDKNDNDRRGNNMEEHNRADQHRKNTQSASNEVNQKQKTAATNAMASPLSGPALPETAIHGNELRKLKGNGDDFQRYLNESQQPESLRDHAQQQDNMDKNEPGQSYHDTAVSQGQKYAWQNSGTQHRLGLLTGKMYEEFLKTLEPGMVQSGEPRPFAWVDGAGRFHISVVIIEIEPANNFLTDTASDNLPEANEKLNRAKNLKEQAIRERLRAGRTFKAGAGSPTDPVNENPAGDGLTAKAESLADAGNKVMNTEVHPGQETRNVKNFDNIKAEAQNEIIGHIEDIVHSRTVFASNFQFHMGSPVKGMWGDTDVMTFYPPVQSIAIASFNYTGMGNISRPGNGTNGSDANHECGLIAAF